MLQLDEYTYNEHHHTSPSSASNTTSLAATLTPGTPTAIEDDSLKRLSLNSVNLTSLSRSSATLPRPPSSTTSESCNSDSSLLSSVGMTPDDEEDDEEDGYQYEDDLDDAADDIYGSEVRHQRAKEAAKILLSQCLLEDNPRYYSDSFSKTSRLGLAPITLLLNPETPCPTKIIPLPDSTTSNSSSSSSYSLSDDCPSSEEEQEAYDVQEAQAASLFIRLL